MENEENVLNEESSNGQSVNDNVTNDSPQNQGTGKKTKFKALLKSKKFIAGVGIVFVALVIGLILSYPRIKFNQVKNKCVEIAGQAGTGHGYFSLDTMPDSYDNMDSTMRALLLPGAQENALEAIKYANKELGFDGVYSQMMKTTALMGKQTEENSHYKVSWSYHPDNGLEVQYRVK